MEVKIGYKQTEVGVIPEDWDVKRLSQISPSQSVGLVINPSSYFSDDGNVPLLVGSNIRENRIVWESANRISDASNRLIPASQLAAGDLVTVRVGEPGTTAVVPTELDGCNCASMMIVRQHKSFNSRWLSYVMNSSVGLKQVEHVQYGTAQKQFNISDAINFLYPAPRFAEQEAIAEALSDADALIESLEQLIAKKRQIKQGAMQELLRPTPNDQVLLLREVSSLKGRIGWQGLKQTEFTTNDDEPFLITGMNFKDGAIRWSEVYHISEARYEMAKDIQLRTGDVLMTKDGTIGKVLYIDLIPHPGRASLNSHLLLFRPLKQSYCPKYLYYQLSSQRFGSFVELSKSGTTFFGISQAAVGNFPVLLPPMGEQFRIASILSDMDEEIAALEAKLAKSRQLKQGMMQELLTGRIRLV
jgi:type I restriction enzyme S subunit